MDSVHKASQAQEKRVAMRTAGNVQPGSGSGYMRKGDVRTIDFLIECKTTQAASYRLTSGVLDKIEREAVMDGREAALFLEIAGKNYVVISEDAFLTLREDANADYSTTSGY